jgi:hypothetical protein
MADDIQRVTHDAEPSCRQAAIADGDPGSFTYTADGTLDTLKSDTDDLPSYRLYRAIMIGGAGDLKWHDWDGNVVGPIAVVQGVYSIRPRRIFLTGTTATQLVGLR